MDGFDRSRPGCTHPTAGELDELRARLTGVERIVGLDRQNSAILRRLAAAEVGAGRRMPRQLPRPAAVGLVSLLVLLAAAFPLVVLAVDIFTDVPSGAPFHDQIEAIALAGITTGSTACAGSGTRFCPNDAVDRKAMAAFLSRGLGRVARKQLTSASLPNSSVAVSGWNTSLTPGLPANLLTGAAGFIKADATLTINAGTPSGGLCQFNADLLIDGSSVLSSQQYIMLDSASISAGSISLTGVATVTTSSAKTIEVRAYRSSGGCSSHFGFGAVTAIYVPFGHLGTNQL